MINKAHIKEAHNTYQGYGWTEVKYKDLTSDEIKGVKECLKLAKNPHWCKVMYVPGNRYLIL